MYRREKRGNPGKSRMQKPVPSFGSIVHSVNCEERFIAKLRGCSRKDRTVTARSDPLDHAVSPFFMHAY